MPHICVNEITIIGSDNGLSPDRRQAIFWTNAAILFIGPLGTNFSEVLIEILIFAFKKMHSKVSSAKRRPFCPGLNVLIVRKPKHMLDVSAHAIGNKRIWTYLSQILCLRLSYWWVVIKVSISYVFIQDVQGHGMNYFTCLSNTCNCNAPDEIYGRDDIQQGFSKNVAFRLTLYLSRLRKIWQRGCCVCDDNIYFYIMFTKFAWMSRKTPTLANIYSLHKHTQKIITQKVTYDKHHLKE